MATDLYQLCPCGSGKKIKFCCRDIISDLERIHRMIEGEQRLAALEKIDKLLEKHPQRPALLCEKARVQMQLSQWDEARGTVEALLEKDPQSMTGLALRSVLRVQDGDLRQAARDVHQALKKSDRLVTQSVYEAIYSLCFGFMARGNVLAARAYLLLLVSMSKGQDRRTLSMLMELDSEPRVSLLLKDSFSMMPCPERVTWRREFDVAIDVERHADWYSAAQLLEDMSRRILDEPAILRNLAILKGRIGESVEAAKFWRMYSTIRGLPLDDAVEAEARAQILDEPHAEDHIDVVCVTQTIDDVDGVMERLLSDRRVQRLPHAPQSSEDEPPPKGVFSLHDRGMPERPDEATLDQIPVRLASLLVFGRETDRPARLLILTARDEGFDFTIRLLGEIIGQVIDASQDVELQARTHKVSYLLSANLAIPPEMSVDQQHALQSARVRQSLLENWPSLKLQLFGGRSAAEVAGEAKYKVPVLAAILNLELQAVAGNIDADLNELRQKLNLPTRETIDPSEVDLNRLPLVRFAYLDVEKLADDDLIRLFEIVTTHTNSGLKNLAEELLRRPHLDGQVNKIEVHEYLADASPDTHETLTHLAAARQLAVAKGESPARWLISELEVHLARADVEHAQRLINEIQTRYINEPGIAQGLVEVLAHFGLVRPSGRGVDPTQRVEPEEMEHAAATDASPALWTPGSDASTATAQGGKESKLWVPGMD